MARANIARTIFQDTEAFPDKPALIEGSRSVAYRELAQTAGRLAAELARRGVGPFDRVAFLCADSVDYVLLSLAILSLDAAIVPISPGLMADECAALLNDGVRPQLVLVDYHLDNGETGTELMGWLRAQLGEQEMADSLTRSQLARAQMTVNLYKALGGGWNEMQTP